MRYLPVVTTEGTSTAINLDQVIHIKQLAYPSPPRMNDPVLMFKYVNGDSISVFGTFDDIRKDLFC